MEAATKKVLEENGVTALQYSSTAGWPALRKWIARRYETMGVYDVSPDDIIVTNGSQQALAMIGAAMINPGDEVIVEDPTYLVALQSFHVFDPVVLPVTMNPDGIDCDELAETIRNHPDAKFAYLIPNFQNPTGLTYTEEVREHTALRRTRPAPDAAARTRACRKAPAHASRDLPDSHTLHRERHSAQASSSPTASVPLP